MATINLNSVLKAPGNTDNVEVSGTIVAGNGITLPAGEGITLTSGGAGTLSGTFTCNGATGVVITTSAAAVGNIVATSVNVPAGTQGALPKVITVVPGLSMSIAGTASDTSLYNWAIIATVG